MLNDDIEILGTVLARKKDKLNIEKAKLEDLKKDKENVLAEIENNKKLLEVQEQCNVLLGKMTKAQRSLMCRKIEQLGTFALQYSLGSEYELKIVEEKEDEKEKKKKKPSVDLFIYNNQTKLMTSPVDDNGGGMVDIISITLRFVILQNYEPVIDGPVILDEPFKMVSKEYIHPLSKFVKDISSDFDRQVIAVTHNEAFAEMADSKICVTIDTEGVSHVAKI